MLLLYAIIHRFVATFKPALLSKTLGLSRRPRKTAYMARYLMSRTGSAVGSGGGGGGSLPSRPSNRGLGYRGVFPGMPANGLIN